MKTIGDQIVYLSIDIDVLDPAFTPATGTIEPGGWTTRELLHILNGLSRAGVKLSEQMWLDSLQSMMMLRRGQPLQ